MDRFRNSVASQLSGVVPEYVNSRGLQLLRLLVSSTPSLESDVAFLPQQRSIFLIQAIQRWYASDEDVSREIDSLLAHLLIHLTPIIQTVDGSHWEFMFDLLDSNMEVM